MTAQFDSAQLQNDQTAAWRRPGSGSTGGIQDVMTRLRAYDPLTLDTYKFKNIFHQEVLATAELIYKRMVASIFHIIFAPYPRLIYTLRSLSLDH